MPDKVGSVAQQFVRQVADVARRTAIQQNPIREVTVISRNPDGSLNVDDGQGGCLRMAPKANVRVGEKIKLGNEPAIGTQTTLSQVNLEIDPSTRPCPDDLRPTCEDLVGVPCAPIEAPFFSSGNIAEIGCKVDGTVNTWADRLDSTKWLAGGGVVNPGLSGIANSFIDTISPHHRILVCFRGFLQFDTGILQIPPGATLTNFEIDLTLILAGSNPLAVKSDDNASIYVVPSTASAYPLSSPADWNEIDMATPLGRFRILDASPLAGYPTLFQVVIPLDDATDAYIDRSGLSKFALVTSLDMTGTAPATSTDTNQIVFKALAAAARLRFEKSRD